MTKAFKIMSSEDWIFVIIFDTFRKTYYTVTTRTGNYSKALISKIIKGRTNKFYNKPQKQNTDTK